jgi:hypothetical protein
MPVAGRSRMPSWHPLSPRWLRFAILAPLASEAGSRARAAPSSRFPVASRFKVAAGF